MERVPDINKKSEYGSIRLNLEKQNVESINSKDGEHLTAGEYQILWLLVRAGGMLVPKQQIFDFLYDKLSDEQDLPLSNSDEVLISRLRAKLKRLTAGKMTIENEHGKGYSLNIA